MSSAELLDIGRDEVIQRLKARIAELEVMIRRLDEERRPLVALRDCYQWSLRLVTGDG